MPITIEQIERWAEKEIDLEREERERAWQRFGESMSMADALIKQDFLLRLPTPSNLYQQFQEAFVPPATMQVLRELGDSPWLRDARTTLSGRAESFATSVITESFTASGLSRVESSLVIPSEPRRQNRGGRPKYWTLERLLKYLAPYFIEAGGYLTQEMVAEQTNHDVKTVAQWAYRLGLTWADILDLLRERCFSGVSAEFCGLPNALVPAKMEAGTERRPYAPKAPNRRENAC